MRWGRSSTLDAFTNRTKSTVAVRLHGSTLCGDFKGENIGKNLKKLEKLGNEKRLNLEKYP